MKIINSIIKETILTFGIIIKELTIAACIVLPILIAYFVISFVITELNRPCDYHKPGPHFCSVKRHHRCGGNPDDYYYE